MNEVMKLLGRQTYDLSEVQQKNSAASNPDEVLKKLQELVDAGYIDEEGLTAETARLAAQGVTFGPVCMDDVTPFDL